MNGPARRQGTGVMRFAEDGSYSFSVFDGFEDIRETWAGLSVAAVPAPLTSVTLLEAWWETVGRMRHEAMRIVLAADATGPLAVFPFVLGRYHTVRYVEWMGAAGQPGRGPLVAADVLAGLTRERALALLDGAAAALDEPIDAMLLRDMPGELGGFANPFLGPEAVAAGTGHLRHHLRAAEQRPALAGEDLHVGTDRLAAFGPLVFETAQSAQERAYLAAILADQLAAASGADPVEEDRLAYLHHLAMTDPADTIDGAGTVIGGLFAGDRAVAIILAATHGDYAATLAVSGSGAADLAGVPSARLIAAHARDWFADAGFAVLDAPMSAVPDAKTETGAVVVPHAHLFRQKTTLGYLLCAGERTLARVKASYHEPAAGEAARRTEDKRKSAAA